MLTRSPSRPAARTCTCMQQWQHNYLGTYLCMHSTYSVRADASTETLNSEALESGSSLEEPQVALLQTMKTSIPISRRVRARCRTTCGVSSLESGHNTGNLLLNTHELIDACPSNEGTTVPVRDASVNPMVVAAMLFCSLRKKR